MSIDRYPIPLYLNQEIVFDLLAIMEGGLSRFESIRTVQSRSNENSGQAEARIGASNVFAFLGLSLGASKKTRTGDADTTESQTEKVYTPNSLFAKVRQQLHADGQIRSIESELIASSFVEFIATLRKNPLISALETMKNLGGMFTAFQPKESKATGKQRAPATSVSSSDPAIKEVMRMIDIFLSQLNAAGTLDLIGTIAEPRQMQAVLTIDPAFMRDPSMSDIVDGQYRVLGKVTRVVDDSSDEGINLLRKTSLGAMPASAMAGLAESFQSLPGFNLPEIVTTISGPAIQVIPIAIYA